MTGLPERKNIIGVFPGSFDPITVAHVSIAERAARMLDRLYVAAAVNPQKKYEFDLPEKMQLMSAALGHIANTEVIAFEDGLTVDKARELGASCMIRGARSVTDFLDEINLFEQNVYVQESIGIGSDNDGFIDTQTYYVLPGQNNISSSMVRGLMHMPHIEHRAERIRPLVPDAVYEAILPRLPENC